MSAGPPPVCAPGVQQVNALEATGPSAAAAASARETTRVLAALTNAQSDAASVSLGAPLTEDVGLPPSFARSDVTVSRGTYTVVGAGAGPHGSEDSGVFAAAPVSASCATFTCRIVAIHAFGQKTIQDGCEVALAARSSLSDAAGNVTLGYSTGHGVHLHYRSLAGVTESDQKDGTSPGLISRSKFNVNDNAPAANYLPSPLWLRLMRSAANWTAYTSSDGSIWTQAGTPVPLEAGGVWGGLWVGSNSANGSMKIQAVFDH